ncbi:MAG: twin-arginine translocation signal domain-containing protein [Gammaproteobacteria bacterium]|nr:twin-arginine translocation signal domain-containing protein [Gammaproteobacteria bacterium]
MTDKHNTLTRRDFVQGAATLAAGAALFPPGASAAGTSRMAIRDYVAHDAMGLAALVKRGEVSAAGCSGSRSRTPRAVNGSITAVCLNALRRAAAALKSID